MSKLARQKPRTNKPNSLFNTRHFLKHSKSHRIILVLMLFGFGFIGYITLMDSQAATTSYNVVSDNFERQSLGSDWTVNFGNVGLVNQSDIGLTAQSGAGIASWVGTTLAADQFSEATVSSNIDSNMLTQVFTRRRASDSARYAFHYDADPNDGAADNWQIKYDGVPTAQTRVLASNSTASPRQPGDTLRLEILGTNPVELKGYRNGLLILSATDSASTAIANGTPGTTFRLATGTTTTYPSPVFESWSGGSLSTIPEPPPATTTTTTTPDTSSSTPTPSSSSTPSQSTTNTPSSTPSSSSPASPNSAELSAIAAVSSATPSTETIKTNNRLMPLQTFIIIGVLVVISGLTATAIILRHRRSIRGSTRD